jgi:OOP family OmpA-OmpF porin
MRLLMIYFIGALLIGLLIFVAIPHYESRIPEQLVSKTTESLQKKGHSWTKVTAAGRDLTISGEAPTLQAHQEAINLVKETVGVRLLTDSMTDKAISPYTMNLDWKNNQLTVIGYLPDETSQQSVISRLKEKYGESEVSVSLDVGGGEPEKWTELVDALISNVPNTEMANFDLVDQALDISAKTQTTEQKEQLLDSLSSFSDYGYTLKSRLIASDATARRCQKRFDEIMRNGNIIFASNQSKIAPQSRTILDSIVETTQLCSDFFINIAGHTDNVGNEAHNIKLSRQRAESVGSWLILAGVDKSKVRTEGYGSSKPIADNSTAEGRAKNRRIQFKVGKN